MWQLENDTPFAAERGWVRDRNGSEVWLVAAKCTFDIHPDGSTTVSAAQPQVLMLPEYLGPPAKSSLKYENDLVLTKKTTDILVLGHAYAPEGVPVSHIDVAVRVGSTRKTVRVFGHRVWRRFGPSSPEPFVKMPLTYERAFGGRDPRHPERDWDWRNPVGTGFATAREHLDGTSLPNIEYPDELIGSWKDRPRPAGFGPICGHWQPRVQFAGTYDDKWMKEAFPLLPRDFNERYFQCAPADQQSPEFLHGGELAVLHGLTAAGPLTFELPKVFLGFETYFYDGSYEIHRQRALHTVIIEPDFPRVSLLWHTALPCHFKVHKLERTVITLKEEIEYGGDNDPNVGGEP